MSIRVVAGEILTKDTTTRTVIPTAAQPRWPPFARIAERIATPRRPFPPHRHEGDEVLTYVIEGSAAYSYGPGPPEPMDEGSTKLLTAPTSVSHAISPAPGRRVRWLAVVTPLPTGKAATVRLQSGRAEPTELQPDGTALRRVVGPGSSLRSTVGLECEAVEFRSSGTTFKRIGHDRLAVIYALSGQGMVDNQPVEAGEAALVDDAAGVALQGRSGFQAMLMRAPRPT
ncbi:MAG: hypothetical protein WA761_06990 [Thermoplasmata archaeon]